MSFMNEMSFLIDAFPIMTFLDPGKTVLENIVGELKGKKKPILAHVCSFYHNVCDYFVNKRYLSERTSFF